MFQLSANLEVLFAEAGPNCVHRARAAADAGFTAVEIWGTSDKDLGELARVIGDHGLAVTSMVAEPNTSVVFPGTDLQPFFDDIDRAVADAQRLSCRRIIVRPGIGFPGFNRQRNLARLGEVYAQVVEQVEQADVVILLEPVNTRTDHPGLLLDRTADAVSVIRKLGSPKLRLLYDFYHSVTEGEKPADELPEAADVLDYVQFADFPGRGAPGTGTIDWAASLALLKAVGYAGPIGLEHIPTTSTAESVRHLNDLVLGV